MSYMLYPNGFLKILKKFFFDTKAYFLTNTIFFKLPSVRLLLIHNYLHKEKLQKAISSLFFFI